MRARVLALALIAAFIFGVAPVLAAVPLRETGSTLLEPLMTLWAAAYQQSHPDVSISTEATGSGTGISSAISGSAELGASDAYLNDKQRSGGAVLNIPLVVGAQLIAYNVPGLSDRHLKLSGSILSGMYKGSIQFWDDKRIRSLNGPDAARLPHNRIVPIRRSDGSGDTFLFTQYLSKSARDWKAGFGTTVTYVAVSYLNQLSTAGLEYASLQAHDGGFLLPTDATLQSAVRATPVGGDGRASLVYRPGRDSYPIVSYEYAIVRREQAATQKAEAIKQFLSWALDQKGGNEETRFLMPLHFVALPSSTRASSESLIKQIR